MRKEQFIKYLTITTITVLAGIITLQVYWLVTSYQQQRSRFKADIQNALSSANVKTTLKKAFNSKNNELTGLVNVENLSASLESFKEYDHKTGTPPLSKLSLGITESLKLLEYLKKKLDEKKIKPGDPLRIEFQLTDEDFKLYRAVYQKELISREIYIPFELAVVTDKGNIPWSSCDSSVFKSIPFKSDVDEFSQVKSTVVYGLQSAFPDANLYVFRKMIWILSVSVLLILIGSYSLGYLLIFFFTQKKLSDLRNDFMNNMTHELKTPISSISVALEMVLGKEKELSAEKRASYLVIAQKELKRLDQLTENILKILSLERTEIKIVKSHIRLLPWVHGISDSLSPLLEDKHAHLTIAVVPETLEMLADKIHMTNVMYNVVENAIKYNNKTNPEIKILATQHEDQLFLQISDNGEGIPAQYIKSVFDKFFRVPKGNRHDVKGYGLGLSYVKGIVEMHQGSVTVSSIPNTGSTFTIQLPLNTL